MHHDEQRPLRDLDDRREVADRIEPELVDARVRRVARRQERQRVAVGWRFDAGLDADQAAGAAPVLDHDLLPERDAELLGDEAPADVTAAAGGEGHDELHRLDGVRLRRGWTGCEKEHRSKKPDHEDPPSYAVI